MRFLHTSDWQLGMSARQLGDKAPEFREMRFAAAARTIDLALAESVDFVLLAGDTFDTSDVDEEVVERTIELLHRLDPVPVFVLPGNHDPLGAGAVWLRQCWRRRGAHIQLLSDAVETPFDSRTVLYPCPVTQKRSRLDPTAWIPSRDDGDRRVRIGVAHGSLGMPRLANFPIAEDRCESAGLDYLALGDWHGRSIRGRAAYPGTIETTSFADQDSGFALLVGIHGEERRLEVEERRVGKLRWLDLEVEVGDESDVGALEGRLAQAAAPESLVLRLRLALLPALPAELRQAVDAMCRRLDRQSFFFDVTIDDEEVRVEWPPGALDDVGRALDQILDQQLPATEFAVFAGEERSALREARTLLRRLTMESAETRPDLH